MQVLGTAYLSRGLAEPAALLLLGGINLEEVGLGKICGLAGGIHCPFQLDAGVLCGGEIVGIAPLEEGLPPV